MKKIILFALFFAGFATARAQWSNTTNQFYDSLDMPVAQATNDQLNPIVIKSQPDGGYFVIWEDHRIDGFYVSDIYAQKYDKLGNALWTANGIPVATGATNQQYSTSKNGYSGDNDFRNVSHAASDGAGGFYIAYSDFVQLGSYDYSRVCVQHVRGDGSVVFGNTGTIIGNPSTAGNTECSSPQLIADGKGGFFIGYAQGPLQASQSHMIVWLYCYKDEGGTLKRYGGGEMNLYTIQRSTPAPCGSRYYLDDYGYGFTFGTAFMIFPDLQNGCGVAMIEQLQNSQQLIMGFNRLCRVKKDCHTTVNKRLDDVAVPHTFEYDYKKDSVVTQYKHAGYTNVVSCNVSSDPNLPPNLVTYTNFLVEQGGQGLRPLTVPALGLWAPAGKMVATNGNIDVCLITWNQRDVISGNTLSSWYTRSATLAIEKYDSIPYQLCSDLTNPYYAYRLTPPDGTVLDKLNVDPAVKVDTLFKANTSAQYEYTLAASGNRFLLATSSLPPQATPGVFPVYYQELNVKRMSADSFALQLTTNTQKGIVIGNGQTAVQYLNPLFATDNNGNAVFYIGEYQNYIRASPVTEGGKMLWGAMGIPLNAARWQGSYTYPATPNLLMDDDGKGLVAWNDSRKTAEGYTGNNVYLRHLDSLTSIGYEPPVRKTQSLTLGGGSTIGVPQVLNGSSNAWTSLLSNVYNPLLGGYIDYSVTAQIKDEYELGTVTMQTYENKGTIRNTTDGKPYLNRNYTISVTNHPAGATIHVRLIFTTAEFDALKAADPAVHDPGDLSVVKQTNASGTVPATYTPVAGEQGLRPIAWAAIGTSGYYIEVAISDFSNFFIMRGAAALPVTLHSFTVNAINNTALLQWETASELNNDHFDIERSINGNVFTKIGLVQGNGTTSIAQHYRFTDAAPFTGNNYYRLAQIDLDGKITYSELRLLSYNGQGGTLKVYPNPVKTTLHIQLPKAASGQDALQLYDLGGLKVLMQLVPAGTSQTDTDISTLASGVYILHYGKESIKVVKQ